MLACAVCRRADQCVCDSTRLVEEGNVHCAVREGLERAILISSIVCDQN